jgi:translation initiation factor IF-2
VILVIGANAGVIGMSKEHLAVALALSVPIVVCITKVSKIPPSYSSFWFHDRWITGRYDTTEQTRRNAIAGGQNSA